MDNTPLNKAEAEEYLRDNYIYDLYTWFTIRRGAYIGCDFIPHMDDQNNVHRPSGHMINNDARRSHIFAAAFRAMVELTQEVIKKDGESAAAEYCKQHGWPLCSAGLAGPGWAAEKMAGEARLLPDSEKYVPFYDGAVALFRELLPGFFVDKPL